MGALLCTVVCLVADPLRRTQLGLVRHVCFLPWVLDVFSLLRQVSAGCYAMGQSQYFLEVAGCNGYDLSALMWMVLVPGSRRATRRWISGLSDSWGSEYRPIGLAGPSHNLGLEGGPGCLSLAPGVNMLQGVHLLEYLPEL